MKASSDFQKTILLSLVAALAGGALGWALRPAGATSIKPASAAAPPGDPGILGRHRMTDRTRERIDALNQAGTPSQQCLAALALGEIETVPEIRNLLENARFFPPHSAESLAIESLLRRWLELEPESAVEYCRAHHIKTLPDLLVNYAATHPAEAERLAGAVPAGYWTGVTWRKVCLGVAATDPEAAWAMLQRTPKEAEHEAAKAAGKLAALDLAGASARIEKLPKSVRGYAKGALAMERMKADPVAGWDWVLRQPDPDYLIQHTVGETLRRHPDQAFALLASLSPEHLSSVREKWRLSFNLYNISDTSTALAASALDPEVRQTIADQFLFVAQQRDPAEAASLFAQMAPDAQLKKLPVFLNYWAAKDSAAARAWREALPAGPLRDAAGMDPAPEPAAPDPSGDQPSGIKQGTLVRDFRLNGYISPNDPRLATLSPQDMDGIMGSVSDHSQTSWLRTLAQQNPAAVTGWLEKTEKITNQTGPPIAQFLLEWAGRNPAEAAGWTGKLPDGDVARTAAVNTASQYRRYAPEAAQAWVDSLPAGPVQDAARRGLIKR